MPNLFICAFDIATHVGAADGYPSERPRCWNWDLSTAGKSRPHRLAMLRDHFDLYLTENNIDCFFYEQGLSLAAGMDIGMQESTFAFLRGAIGVAESCAAKAKVPIIKAVNVQDARRHLLGAGRIPKGEGKQLVFDRCKALRWPVTTQDEADACAIWSLGCGEANPLTAHMTTPLFSGAPR